jgi:hypothetical protein
MKDFYVALIHHPVIDRHKTIVTSSVTNLDLHDIARSCRTFNVKRYFVVHPSPDEQALNARIVNHWHTGYGVKSHPTRTVALDHLELKFSFDEALARIRELSGEEPLKFGTHARMMGDRIVGTSDLLKKLEEKPVVLIFGTAYGLAPEWAEKLDFFLQPINGPEPYNHLSVRSAVAIYLDRLFGNRTS